jgi:tetratricopeptide (TPR) repeat protein
MSQSEPIFRSHEEWTAARDRQAAEAVKERARAEKLWRRLAADDRSLWRDRVLSEPEFQVWAFCEKLCNESAELEDDDADQAFELAQLALLLVSKVHCDEKLLCGIQQHIWMHIGNAFRARGDLMKAEESFKQAGEFLLGSMAGSLPSVILRDRLAALEAALLRDQGYLVEALRKINHAISLAGDHGAYRPSLFLEEARLHRRLGQPEKALQALGWAERAVQSSIQGRLLTRIRIELGNTRCDLGRHAEVEKVPGSVRKGAESFPLERARLLCLEGRVAAGLGRLEEARAVLEKARAEIHDRVVPELVLLSLETGALCVRQGKTTELKSLAEQTLQLVGAAGLKGAGAATLKLWCRLAAGDKLSFEHATRFIHEWIYAPAAR